MLTARSGGTGRFPNTIEIRSLAPGDDAAPSRTLNEEWITRYFTLEAKAMETLSDQSNQFFRRAGISSWPMQEPKP